MSLLFDISTDVLINLLSKWCEVNDLGRLDTAFCSVKERSNLMKIFCSPGFDLHSAVTLKGLQFCADKGIAIKSIVLFQKDFKANRHRNIAIDKLNTQKVTKMQIVRDCLYEHSNETIIFCYQLANRCNALEKLMLIGCGRHFDMFITSLSISILHNLKVFSSSYSTFSVESFQYLAEHCMILESVSVEHNCINTPELDIQSLLIATGRSLNKISIVTTILTNKTLQCVMDHCPRIIKVKLGLNNEVLVSLSLVNLLLTKCTALKSFSVGSAASKISMSHINQTSIIMINPLIAHEHDLLQFFTHIKQNNVIKLNTIPYLSATILNTIALHNSTSLKSLYIADCPLISTTDVMKLINILPKLKKLSIQRCPLFEKNVVKKFLDGMESSTIQAES